MATTLSKIIATAKQLRKKNKSLTWKQAVKNASALYRAGSKNKVVKKSKVYGVKESNELKKVLKAKKIKLPHGYATEKRKLLGSVKKTDPIGNKGLLEQRNHIEKCLKDRLYHFNWHKEMSVNKKRDPNLRKNDKATLKIIAPQIKTFKLHLKEINSLIQKSYK